MSDRQQVQKQRERFYATEVARRLNEEWQLTNGEAPDFLVKSGGQEFGLEVTECHIGPKGRSGAKMRAAESANEKWLSAIRKELTNYTQARLHLRYLGKATEVSRRMLLDELISASFDDRPDFEQVRGRFEGGKFWAFKCPHPSWVFMEDRVGWVSTDPTFLQREINAKATNLSRYKMACENVRLLVVADRIYNSGKLEVGDDFMPDLQGFEVVYFFPYPLDLRAWNTCAQK